jgi:hypothetical protein
MSEITLWYFVQGFDRPRSVTLPPTTFVDDLKKKINERVPLGNPLFVYLWKVRYFQ